MTEDEVRQRAAILLTELAPLDNLATSQLQRRNFKDAQKYLSAAVETGSQSALKLGSYWLAAISLHVQEVQGAKQKGKERMGRKEKCDD